MKRFIKSLLCFLLTAVFCSAVVSVSAESFAEIRTQKDSFSVGESITLTVTFEARYAVFATDVYLIYDTDILKYESGADNVIDDTVRWVDAKCDSRREFTFTAVFTAISSGEANFYAEVYSAGQRSTNVFARKAVTVKEAKIPKAENESTVSKNKESFSEVPKADKSVIINESQSQNEEENDNLTSSEIPPKATLSSENAKEDSPQTSGYTILLGAALVSALSVCSTLLVAKIKTKRAKTNLKNPQNKEKADFDNISEEKQEEP